MRHKPSRQTTRTLSSSTLTGKVMSRTNYVPHCQPNELNSENDLFVFHTTGILQDVWTAILFSITYKNHIDFSTHVLWNFSSLLPCFLNDGFMIIKPMTETPTITTMMIRIILASSGSAFLTNACAIQQSSISWEQFNFRGAQAYYRAGLDVSSVQWLGVLNH